jgi:hypothetical protein
MYAKEPNYIKYFLLLAFWQIQLTFLRSFIKLISS